MKLSPCPHRAVTRSRVVAVLAGRSCVAAVMATAGPAAAVGPAQPGARQAQPR